MAIGACTTQAGGSKVGFCPHDVHCCGRMQAGGSEAALGAAALALNAGLQEAALLAALLGAAKLGNASAGNTLLEAGAQLRGATVSAEGFKHET